MRSVDEIRARKLSQLEQVLLRPAMWGQRDTYEVTVYGVLSDLAFIDARDDVFEREMDDLRGQGLFRSRGVHGTLAGLGVDDGPATDRTASVYARVASRLGYFRPARRLTAAEWRGVARLGPWVRATPRSVEDVQARLGAPSYPHAGQHPRVLAYAGPTDDAWLYFDFEQRLEGARLEFVRMPRPSFARSVIDLRRHGRAIRRRSV